MDDGDAVFAAGAVALSNSATLAALLIHLKRLGVISHQDEREIFEDALLLLEENHGGDESGVFDAARELIESQLKPEA